MTSSNNVCTEIGTYSKCLLATIQFEAVACQFANVLCELLYTEKCMLIANQESQTISQLKDAQSAKAKSMVGSGDLR